MPIDTATISCFGKIPTHGDFVRYHANGPIWQELDRWLQNGFFLAKKRGSLGEGTRRSCAFVFNPAKAPGALVGVIRSSRDRSGRHFPFATGFSTPPIDLKRMIGMPLRYEAFFKQAACLVREATTGRIDYQDLSQRMEGMRIGPPPDLEALNARFQQRTTFKDFVEMLWDHFDDTRKYLLLKNLIDVLRPFRTGSVEDSGPLHLTYGLKFPLGADRSTVACQVSFWVECCFRLMHFTGVRPSCFWALPDQPEDESPFFILFLHEPIASINAFLFVGEDNTDSLFALDNVGRDVAAQVALSIPPRYGQLLESDEVTLWRFLRQL